MALQLTIEYDVRSTTLFFGREIRFIGKTKRRFWKINWTLFNQTNEVVATYVLKQKPLFLNSKLLIDAFIDSNSTPLILFYRVWKAPHVRFEYQNEQYLLVFHIGNKFSFFKNDKQFALLKKESFSIKYSKKCKVIADSDTSLQLLAIISYSILILTEDEFDQASDLNIDLGNLGPELRSFDHSWRPKDIA